MAGGGLADPIEQEAAVSLPTGQQRANAALQAAQRVAALHLRKPRLLHRDINERILQGDGEMCAFMFDGDSCGIQRLELSDSDKQVASEHLLCGTPGYHAPETRAPRFSRSSIKVFKI